MLWLKILGALLALALGIWLGLPGRFDQSHSDIEELMDQPGTRRQKKVKRHFTPMAWLQRGKPPKPTHGRHRIRLQAPDDDDRRR